MIALDDLPGLTPQPAIEDPSGLWMLTEWVARPLGELDERVRYWWCEDNLVEIGLEVRLLDRDAELPYRWFAKVPRVKGNTVGRAATVERAELLAMRMLEEMLLYPKDFRRQVSDRAYEGLWTDEWRSGDLVLGRWHRTTPGNARARFVRSWMKAGDLPRKPIGRPPAVMVRELEDRVSWRVDGPIRGRTMGEAPDRALAFAACEEVLENLSCERIVED
jgi:hypothetical protein